MSRHVEVRGADFAALRDVSMASRGWVDMVRGSLGNVYLRMTRPGRALGFVAAMAAFGWGCPSGNDRCDENEVLVKADNEIQYCACAPGTIMSMSGYGCTPCGKHEESKNNQCVCKTGYLKLTATGPCEESSGQEIGATCSDNTACSDPFPYCAADGGESYCTKQKCKAGDCPSGFSCDETPDPSFCARLPSGIGEACTAGGNECGAFAASYCDSFMTQTCFINACATGEHTCPGEFGCCDLSSLAPVPLSLCFPPNQLQNGACPVGMLVKP